VTLMKYWCGLAFTPTEHYLDLARAADEAGIHGIVVSDHVLWPQNLSTRYPYSPHADGRPIWEPDTPWPDAWVAIGAMSAVTSRLQFGSNVFIPGLRNVFATAKQVGTAAVISGNRVHLGVGAGWMREEFELLGQDFDTRGKRLDETIQALRLLWQGGWQEFHGEAIDFGAVQLSPVPSARIPIWVGGHTMPALRRAARIGDGWIGAAYPEDVGLAHVATLQRLREEYGTADRRFEIILGVYALPTEELHVRVAAAGVTGLLTAPWHFYKRTGDAGVAESAASDLAHKVDAIRRFGAEWCV
jgi:probable F420-dependent oxidoreductase